MPHDDAPIRSRPLFQLAAELYEEARQRLPEARDAYVRDLTAGDPELRAAVLRMLAHAESPDSALDGVAEQAAAALVRQLPWPDDTLAVGQSIGAYRILRRIGRGGMGTVYEAEQASPHRRVALKLMQTRGDAPAELRSRFRREVEVLGRLNHPGIARIIEAGVAEVGQDESRLFFTMELVDGLPLVQHATVRQLSTRDRLQLVALTSDAIEHAHRLGVVHRDLKPANILVGADGQPKVLDFGIARLTRDEAASATVQTTAGDVLGTVAYMSPEQVAGRTDEIDARTDVHALGVIAFELVSGQLPYPVRGLSLPAAARMIQEEEPQHLGDLNPDWRGEVETIVGKALDKDRERRYPSAAALATDIRRWLAHEPIAARSPTTAYRLAKFAQRNKAVVAGLIGVLASLTLGMVLSTRFALQASERAREGRRETYRASLAAAVAATRDGDPMARVYLDDAPEEWRGWEWQVLSNELDRSVRTFTLPEAGRLLALAFSDDDRSLLLLHGSASAPAEKVLAVLDARSGAVLRSFSLSRERPLLLRPQELRFARSHAVFPRGEAAIEYRDIDTGVLLARDLSCGDATGIREVLALGGDVAIVAGASGEALACDLATGRPVAPADRAIFVPHGRAGISRDGRHVAVFHDLDQSAVDAAGADFRNRLLDGRDQVMAFSFVASGDRLATVTWNGQLTLWDVRRAALLEKHRLSPGRLDGVIASPDGERLAIADAEGPVWLWDIAEARVLVSLAGHRGGVRQVAFNSDGSLLATAGDDGTMRLWDVSAIQDFNVLRGHESYVYPVCFSPDGTRIYSESWDGVVRVWDAETREPVAALPGGSHWDLAVSPDGHRLAEGNGATIRLLDARTGELLASRTDPRAESWGKEIHRLRWNREGELTVAASDAGGKAHRVALHPDSLTVLHVSNDAVSEWPPSPDGSSWVRLTAEGGIELRSSEDGRLLRTLETGGVASPPGEERAGGRAWHPAGSGLAMGVGRDIHVWRGPAWKEMIIGNAHARRINSLAFSPDGRLLASGGGDPVVRLWDAETMALLLQLRGHESYVWMLAWSPDGKQLVSSSGDKSLRVWDSVPLKERWQAREHRRAARGQAQHVVEPLFAELVEPGLVADAVAIRMAGESATYRRAALDLVLTLAAQRREGTQAPEGAAAVTSGNPGPDELAGRRPH